MEDLYCLAFAPVQGTGLDEMPRESEDFNVETMRREVLFLQRLGSAAFQTFFNELEKHSGDSTSTEAAGSAVFLLSEFLKRFQGYIDNARTIAEGTLTNEGFPDYSKSIRDLSELASSQGITMQMKDLEAFFDTEQDSDWAKPNIPGIPKSKGVGFRREASVITSPELASGAPPVFYKNYKAISESSNVRTKPRQQTGYPNKTIKEILDEEIRQNNLEVEKRKKEKQEKAEITKLTHEEVAEIFRPNRQKEDFLGESNFGALCCGRICGEAEEVIDEPALLRRDSSVTVGDVQEIEDDEADKNWHENQRHKQRFSRIRNRIPTGKPSLMKSESEDLISMTLDANEEEKERDALMQNTFFNEKLHADKGKEAKQI